MTSNAELLQDTREQVLRSKENKSIRKCFHYKKVKTTRNIIN